VEPCEIQKDRFHVEHKSRSESIIEVMRNEVSYISKLLSKPVLVLNDEIIRIHTVAPGLKPALFIGYLIPDCHQTHHGRNLKYINKNHDDISIIRDRLFSTFYPEEERSVYGLTKTSNTTSYPLSSLISH
jgi:hypothetical protein